MNNDYERHDFWHRELANIKPKNVEKSMKMLVESNRLFDEKNRKETKYNPSDRSDYPSLPDWFYSIL
jgi:hypothetical protein